MAGHQGMPHGMPMSVPNQIPSSGATTGMSQIPGQQIPMTQPQQKMIPSPQVQQQQQHQQQQTQQVSHHPDHSSIEKMKALVPHLKKALSNLMRLAGESLRRDDIYASSSSSSTTSLHSVEKALEEFFAICDQLEMHLGIALEGFSQVIQHKKYLNPEYIKYSFPPGQNIDVVQHYNAFSTVIRSQVALASSLTDALINCADQISATPPSATAASSNAPSAPSSQPSRIAHIGQPQPGTQFSPGGVIANPVAGSAVPSANAAS